MIRIRLATMGDERKRFSAEYVLIFPLRIYFRQKLTFEKNDNEDYRTVLFVFLLK
jgi:hypothetical protein